MLMLIRFATYGALGWCAEIIFTAVVDALSAMFAGHPVDLRLPGETYLWMHFAYGAGGLLFELLHDRLTRRGWSWPARGVAYAVGCFAFEYVFGWSIRALTGTAPWSYAGARWNVSGLIRLDYAAYWAAFGFALEIAEPLVKTVAVALTLERKKAQ
jgi:uncharacterized membrane protein